MNSKAKMYMKQYFDCLEEWKNYMYFNYYPEVNYQIPEYKESYYLHSILDHLHDIESYIQYFRNAKDMIGEENYRLLMDDYCNKSWKNKYPTSTYYRKSHKAQEAFIEYMDKYVIMCER